MTWKIIPTFPKYEINFQGEVRNAETKILKKISLNAGSAGYVFYTGHSGAKRISKSTLLSATFGTEKALQKRKTTQQVLQRDCGNCAWQYGGKCSVRNPGMETPVENDDKCGKWERIREEHTESEFAEDNYENSFTAQFEGVSTAWEGYALSGESYALSI